MALPTPLTSAQVAGAADVGEIRAAFSVGPNRGLVLLVSKTDPNLVGAIADGSVVVEDREAFAAPPAPTFTGISPTTVAAGVRQFVITGTNITSDYLVWPTLVAGPTDAVYTPTSITFTLDYTGQEGQTDSINMRKDSTNVHLFQMPVTAT